MEFKNVYIEKMSIVEPIHYLTSSEIENILTPLYERLKFSKDRLEFLTGIKRRGYWEPSKVKPSCISSMAGDKITKVNKDIDLLIHASVCRDFLEPATASVIHKNLDLPASCSFFDLSNACLGVLSAIMYAAPLIDSGFIKNALIVSGENSGPLLLPLLDFLKNNEKIDRESFKKYLASFTLGSAGVAFLISKTKSPFKILGGTSLSDSSANELCQGSGDTNQLIMETQSEELMKAGIKLAQENFKKFKSTFPKINKFIPHQVGAAHLKELAKSLELNDVPSFSTFEEFGNSGSAALPFTLIKAHENNFFKEKDHIGLLGIGSGLSSIMLSLGYQYE